MRQVTAKFHRVEAAIEAGYELGYVNGAGNRIITGCIAHPTAGAMGYHYFNKELVDDLVVDVEKPEALVYAPGADGELKLVAVEYVVPGPNSKPPGVSEPPTVLGMQMHILVPAVGFYILHAGSGVITRQTCSQTGIPKSDVPRSAAGQSTRRTDRVRPPGCQISCEPSRSGRRRPSRPRRRLGFG